MTGVYIDDATNRTLTDDATNPKAMTAWLTIINSFQSHHNSTSNIFLHLGDSVNKLLEEMVFLYFWSTVVKSSFIQCVEKVEVRVLKIRKSLFESCKILIFHIRSFWTLKIHQKQIQC